MISTDTRSMALGLLLALALCAGCESTSSTAGGDDDGASDADGDSDGDADGDADSDADSDGDDTDTVCDEQTFDVEYVPVKLMILLDMSGSMVIPASKYESARTAITDMLTDFADSFMVGFDTYPDVFGSQSCAVADPIWFDCDYGIEGDIIDWLDTHTPVLGTGDPLVREMDQFLNVADYAPNFMSSAVPGEPYILIVADGDDCCGPDGDYSCGNSWVDELAERTALLLDEGIKTMVIGYSENADETALNAIAAEGGTEFDTYVPALDEDALVAALETIAGSIVSCVFEIDDPDISADPDNINFFFDDVVIPYDEDCSEPYAWHWVDDDHTIVEFCEEACDLLQGGGVDNVTAIFGCPTVEVE